MIVPIYDSENHWMLTLTDIYCYLRFKVRIYGCVIQLPVITIQDLNRDIGFQLRLRSNQLRASQGSLLDGITGR